LLFPNKGAATFSITTFSIKILSIMGLFAAFSITTFIIMTLSTESHHAECRYVECRNDLNVMLNVFMLSAVMLSVVAPQQGSFTASVVSRKKIFT
jgi:hypothetical protein